MNAGLTVMDPSIILLIKSIVWVIVVWGVVGAASLHKEHKEIVAIIFGFLQGILTAIGFVFIISFIVLGGYFVFCY